MLLPHFDPERLKLGDVLDTAASDIEVEPGERDRYTAAAVAVTKRLFELGFLVVRADSRGTRFGMTLRRRGGLGARDARTQGAPICDISVRPRTTQRAAQPVSAAQGFVSKRVLKRLRSSVRPRWP